MAAMTRKFKEGETVLWVAPSGGRDCRDLKTKKVPVAPFDQKTIDLFRLLGNKSKKSTHFYPMALVSYDLYPPPDFIESGIGEKRNVRYVPVGLALGEEVPNIGVVESRHLFTEHAEAECIRDYEKLLCWILIWYYRVRLRMIFQILLLTYFQIKITILITLEDFESSMVHHLLKYMVDR